MFGRKNQEMKVRIQSNSFIFHIMSLIHFIGSSVINVRKFWEKLLLAARAIVAVENPADVCAISCQPQGNEIFFDKVLFHQCLNIRPTCCIEICEIHGRYRNW